MTVTQDSETFSNPFAAPPHLDFFREQLDFPWFSISLLSAIFGFSPEGMENIRSREHWRGYSEEVPAFSGGTKIETFYDARSMNYRTRMELVSKLVVQADESFGMLFSLAEKAAPGGELLHIDGPVLAASLFRSWQLQYAVDASRYMDLSPKDAIVAVSEGFLMPYDILRNLCSYYDNKAEGSFLRMARELRFQCVLSYCVARAGHLYPEFDFYAGRDDEDPVCFLPSRSFHARELKDILKLSLREIERKAKKYHWTLEWFPNEQGVRGWRFLSMDSATRSAIMQHLAFGEQDSGVAALVH